MKAEWNKGRDAYSLGLNKNFKKYILKKIGTILETKSTTAI